MSAAAIAKARSKPRGVVLWEGRSLLNGAPIVAIATGINGSSVNEKTGAMVQVWILLRDVSPGDALHVGADTAVCGDCVLRPVGGLGACYVNVGTAPTMIWNAFRRGRYPRATEADLELIRQHHVRFGAYGDPVAVPVRVWRSIIPATPRASTGYTHLWRRERAGQYQDFLMASVETLEDAQEARDRGWRCFLVLPHDQGIPVGFFWCGKDKLNPVEGGPCSACGLCNGARPGRHDKDVAIYAHGPAGKTFSPSRERRPLDEPLKPRGKDDPFFRTDANTHARVKMHCHRIGIPMKKWVALALRRELIAGGFEGPT